MTFQNNFYNPDGSFYSPKVSDMYIPETLGYTYGLAPAPAAAVVPAIVALGDKMKTLYATPNVSSAAGIKTFTAPNVQQAAATASKPLDIAVEVDHNLLAAVARRAPAGAGSELLDFNPARERAASGPRALAFIREIAVTQHENTLYRVFIDCDYLSQGTPISDPHYIGTFGIFGDHEDRGGKAAAKPSIVVDLTRAIKRVYGSATELTGRIRIQILPVPNKSTSGPPGTAAPARVEVAFVSA
jgi:tyrosinase